ncbi:MAG: adenylate/guanylate cyclase domain-containing protein [Myxococcota bacterium]
MARVTIIGPEGQEVKELLPHNTLGRHPNNTMQILDRIVSKEHCHIDLVGGQYVLKDLGSLNGTFVNGERLHGERTLQPGDEVTLGSTRIIFHDDPPTNAADPTVEAVGRSAASRGAAAEPAPQGPTQAPAPPRAAPPPPPAAQGHGQGQGSPGAPARPVRPNKVTIAPGMVESHIRTKLAPLIDQSFLPEKLVEDHGALRRDYEKLRVSYEVIRAIGVELDVDKLLAKILDCAFELLAADRGVVLLYDEERELKPRAVRTKAGATDEEVVLSTTIINEVLRDKAAVLSNDAATDARFSGAHSIIMQGIRSSMAVPLLHSGEVFGIMVLDSQVATNAFTEKDLQLFQNIANQAAIAIQNTLYAKKLEQEAVTRERFQRLLSPAIAEQVISGKVEVKKGGEARDTTILFTDIRGFTSMSEFRSAQDIVDMLNEYFERMVEIIFRYEGTLDKFVGDEIMALFGAPVSHRDDAYRAVKTALEMLDALELFNQERVQRGEEPVKIGIGINSGEVVAGYLGSSRALEYTVIGDVVNTGARLCSIAKPGQIIISEFTHERVKEYFEVTELPPTHVKGKSHPLKTFQVLSEKAQPPGWVQPEV